MIKKIYFIGIKGVGMMGLSIIAKQAGIMVAGSDIEEEFITDKVLAGHNIDVCAGFKKENVDDFFKGLPPQEGMVIATGAHLGFDNEEAVYAASLGYKVISHGEAVGLFMNGQIFDRHFEGISVSGSHGKTTISGLFASVLSTLGFDPSYTVGTSEIFPLGSGGHYGSGKYFIAEADEYVSEKKYDQTPKFLYQKPKFLLINNIDFDHPDFYADIQAIENAYLDFASNLKPADFLIANGDDEHVSNVIKRLSTNPAIITFGTDRKNDFVITRFLQEKTSSYFSVETHGMLLSDFSLSIPGYHNAKNATGVISLLIQLGVSIDKIKEALPKFLGVKRRFERVGETENHQIIIDDYAHHPDEIRKTLSAIRLVFPEKKILAVFQPHTYSRTRALLPDFVSSFSNTDELILLPTFASQREEEGENFDQEIIETFRKINKNAIMMNKEDVVEYIRKNYKESKLLILTLGAGDVYKIAYGLAEINTDS